MALACEDHTTTIDDIAALVQQHTGHTVWIIFRGQKVAGEVFLWEILDHCADYSFKLDLYWLGRLAEDQVYRSTGGWSP